MFVRQLLFLWFALAVVNSYEVNTFFERVLLTDYDWRSCCNDQFLPASVWARIKHYREQCQTEFPDSKDCAIFCIITKFKEYDTIYGFHEDVILSLLGTKGLVLSGRDDWKIPIADRLVRSCLNPVNIIPNDDTLICNPDISKFGNCYCDGMVSACPASLKNATNC